MKKTTEQLELEARANNIGWSYGLTMSQGEVSAMIRGLMTGQDGRKHMEKPMSLEKQPA